MKFIEKIALRKDDEDAYLDCYLPDAINNNPKREAILVIPGGGYHDVCSDREGEPIAFAFMKEGFNAFVLHYGTKEKAMFPSPLVTASLAMKLIYDNAEEWNVDKEKIYAVGFSAGGHLCASLGNMWNREEVLKQAGIQNNENRPKAVGLIYPVITANGPTHLHTIENASGMGKLDIQSVSVENFVGKHSSPAFIFHTANDQCVPVHSSLTLAEAYAREKVHFELHVYPNGSHGMALANKYTEAGHPHWVDARASRWVSDCVDFFRNIENYMPM